MNPLPNEPQVRDDEIAVRLVEEIYGRLRGYAALCVREHNRDHTPTSIVHDAILRLGNERRFEGPEHLFACAAVAIRHTLVDRARRRGTRERNITRVTAPLEEIPEHDSHVDAAILELDGALAQLATVDPRAARVVELRFFGGLSLEDVAKLLEVSRKTVSEDWTFARAWLSRRLGGRPEEPS